MPRIVTIPMAASSMVLGKLPEHELGGHVLMAGNKETKERRAIGALRGNVATEK